MQAGPPAHLHQIFVIFTGLLQALRSTLKMWRDKNRIKEIEVKTLVSILIAGALCSVGAFADSANTPHAPFRPLNKRPSGARQAAATESKVNVESPKLPFRHYQKQPTPAPSNKPSSLEASKQ
jgi:hypothetical protein